MSNDSCALTTLSCRVGLHDWEYSDKGVATRSGIVMQKQRRCVHCGLEERQFYNREDNDVVWKPCNPNTEPSSLGAHEHK